MIPVDFAYARPDTKEDAARLYAEFAAEGLRPVYYGGGSEILTMSRSGGIRPGAVIDVKRIPEMNALASGGGALVIGGGATLRAITDSSLFPLLGAACGRIADHTNQCRITLGGNLCGTIVYRETAQALLLTDAELLLFGPAGLRAVPMRGTFCRRLALAPGEMVLGARVPERFLGLPFCHVKKTASERIDYPLISVSSMRCDGLARYAFSGVVPYPFRSDEIDRALGDPTLPARQRIDRALAALPEPPLSDYQGSGAYRLFVLRNTLSEMLEVWDAC